MKNKFLIAILGLSSISLTSCGQTMSAYPDADKYIAGNHTYEQNISVLDIDWISGAINLVEDETIDYVKIEEKTNLTKEQELVHSYLNNDELKIKYFASGYTSSWKTKVEKILTVTYKPGLTNIKIDLTSGILNAKSITAKKFELDMTSGTAVVDNIISEDVSSYITSGSVTFGKVTTKTFDSDSTSGDTTVNFVSVESASFDCTSGDIKMALPEDGGKVKVSKTSGKVSTTRECSINGNTYIFGTGAADIKVSMTSGSVTIG